jgi:hypothetical protein
MTAGDASFDDFDFPWPDGDHSLLQVGRDWTSHAILNCMRPDRQGRIDGYRRAAEVLAARMLRDRGDLDILVFPFAACWRHHIELRLKALIVDIARLDGQRPARKQLDHDFLALWAQVLPLIRKLGPEELHHVPDNAGRVLRELHQLDPTGQEFRYATRKDGTPTLPGHERFDIRHFEAAMEGVANFLSGVAHQVDAELDLAREYEQEMRWEAGQ